MDRKYWKTLFKSNLPHHAESALILRQMNSSCLIEQVVMFITDT